MRRKLTDRMSREIARRTLDAHWDFVRRLARDGIVHFCVWDKYHHKEQRNEMRCGLIDGLEFLSFVRQHRHWFGRGAYDRARNTFPIWLTAGGRQALRNCAYRSEVVLGGMVEPGYQVMPIEFHRDLNEQRKRCREHLGLSAPTFIRPLVDKAEVDVFKPSRRRRRAKVAA